MFNDAADPCDGRRRRAGERYGQLMRDGRAGACGEEQFVVFAVGEGAERVGDIGVERHGRGFERDAEVGGFGDACRVASEAVGDIEHGVEVWTERIGEGDGLAHARLESQVAAGGEGVAEAAGDVNVVAALSAGAGDGAAGGVGVADERGGEDERARGVGGGRGDVAADERAVKVQGPVGEALAEFVGVGAVGREEAGGEGECGRAGHRGDVGDRAGDSLARDEVNGSPRDRREVTAFDELVDGEEERAGGVCVGVDDGAVVAWAEKDAREARGKAGGAREDGTVQVGLGGHGEA